MSHRHPWHGARDEGPLVGRAADVPPSEEPLGAKALDELAGERFGRIPFGGDAGEIGVGEGEVTGERLGVACFAPVAEGLSDLAFECQRQRFGEHLPGELLFSTRQVVPRRPHRQHALDALAVVEPNGRSERLRILRDGGFDHLLAHPVARLHDEVRIALFVLRHVARVLGVLIRRPAVVELVKHLGLVERQVTVVGAYENIALAAVAVGLDLSCGAEVVRVVGHVEQRLERQPPGVGLGLAVPRLAPEHRHAAVDGLGELGVGLGAKDVGQLPVLGLRRAISSGVSVKRFSGRRRSSVERAKKTKWASGEWPSASRSSSPLATRDSLLAGSRRVSRENL